ncbi:hypothetical protein ACFL27_18430 [candidate division CSSED10-310 bacterium]|uniref:Alanine dehydrogenase/pyridine nucleotide transhydrogenase N-terminal domain-containing protein n=1 Tax=candidate division CSSED10-310 bacterium TaxID=2855610 RepID=A0ABV6Z148_UNCC1
MKALALRAEDKNIWEKRTPLIPDHIATLLADHEFSILVEPSSRRIFPEAEFTAVGAQVTDNIDQADIIIGIKEIPPAKIYPNKVYLFFSHTIKGQAGNMPLLQKILDSGSTLLDYEKIIDEHKRRILYFGKFAGDAGAVDILWLIGQELRRLHLPSPLSHIKQALSYKSLAHAQQEIRPLGDQVRTQGYPEMLTPFVVGIFGYGNVSQGAQEIFELFPHLRVEPEDLPALYSQKNYDNKTLYLSVFHEHHMVKPKSGRSFSLQDYYQNPQHYEPITAFYLPYLKCIVNAVFWNNQYPHFVSQADVRHLFASTSPAPFLAIADVSCDLLGAMETTVKITDPGAPAYKYNPLTSKISEDFDQEGILVLAVDNLPCEFAYDSSVFFSAILKDMIPALLDADFSQPLPETGLPAYLQRAVVALRGELTPDFLYLNKYL